MATTRPELLAACVGMFVHPDDPRSANLVGRRAIVPLFHHEVEIRTDDKAAPDKGTGIVMCCTFGDKTDVEWYPKHEREIRQAIGADGRMTERAGAAAGDLLTAVRR